MKGDVWAGNIDQAIALIEEKENFLFCGDIDPDSVGSMMSLALFLRLMDKQASIVLENGLNENLDYLISILEYNSIRILKTEDEIKNMKESVDAIVICDTANTKLVPFYSVLSDSFLNQNFSVIEIDHHFGADSEELTEDGIKLFREANATTEIIGELLQELVTRFPETTDPFNQRNILIGLITGLLGDTVGGKVVPLKEDFDYWMKELGARLTKNTRWRGAKEGRPADSKDSKFASPEKISEYLDRLSDEQEGCLTALTNRINNKNGLGFLNLMEPTYKEVEDVCQPYNSDWFADILGFLLNRVPEEAGKIGVICFNGKNAEGKECIFVKLRRAVAYDGFDLRQVEDQLKGVFDGSYMGGGGHPGAVSFRIVPQQEEAFLSKLEPVADYIQSNMK
ncbi:MAG: hypothetical protein QF607_03035 [Nitrospinaceae bacterium]|nr:hypothetical protein [Nitrospinaceae bacterium]